MTFGQDIDKFNRMYKLPVATHPTLLQLGVPAWNRMVAFRNILSEELDELDPILGKLLSIQTGALFNPADFKLEGEPYVPTTVDVLTDLADLLGDIQVYCASEMAKFGLPLDAVLTIIMQSNLSKMGADGKPIYDERGKLQKGPNYWKPEPKIRAMLTALRSGEEAPVPTGLTGIFDPLPFVEE
jgi:hypothetical protein